MPPVSPDQVAIDKATADREDFVVGDTITVLTDTGSHEFTITALVGLGDTDGFAGATLAAWDVDTAAEVLGAGDSLDGVDVAVAEGVDVATVQSRIEEILPPGTEVITRDVLVDESKADLDVFINAFQTGLLIFAFVTAFVSAFLINNVFQITIGQRLRELALLRAVGASGSTGAPDDLRRGAGDVRRRDGDRDRRRRRAWPSSCSRCSTRRDSASRTPARCCCRGASSWRSSSASASRCCR